MKYESAYLAHHGILGMKWGVRRYQNPDGSLTPKGEKRYSRKEQRQLRKDVRRDYREAYNRETKVADEKSVAEYRKAEEYAKKHYLDPDDYVEEYNRKELLDNAAKNGPGEKRAKHLTRYSEMLDEAGEKEEAYWSEASEKALQSVYDKYGKETVDSIRSRDQRISSGATAVAAVLMVGGLVALSKRS